MIISNLDFVNAISLEEFRENRGIYGGIVEAGAEANASARLEKRRARSHANGSAVAPDGYLAEATADALAEIVGWRASASSVSSASTRKLNNGF